MNSLRSARLTRTITALVLFVLYLIAFWTDLGPGFRGASEFVRIITGNRPGPLESVLALSMYRILLGALVFIPMFMTSLFIVAQFALPVQKWPDRWNAYARLLLYWTKLFRGPAMFVRDGKLVKWVGEAESTNPGVVVVDMRSAVVVEYAYPYSEHGEESADSTSANVPAGSAVRSRRSTFISGSGGDSEYPMARSLGPGIQFTRWGEKIRATVDLRRQVRLARGEPTKIDGKQIQLGGIRAFTHDGIELGANCYVVFGLSDPPDVIKVGYWGDKENAESLCELELDKEGDYFYVKKVHRLDASDAVEIHEAVRTGGILPANAAAEAPKMPAVFPFDEDRVFAAAYGQSFHSDHPEHRVQWDELPLIIAGDYYRNLLEKYDFDYLYSMDDPGRLPWLDEFKPEFSRRVRYQGILSFEMVRLIGDWDWKVDLKKQLKDQKRVHVRELEFSASTPLIGYKPLRARGIKVVVAGFSEPKIPYEIRERMVDRWRARWDREIQIALARLEREAAQIIINARTNAQRDNAFFLSSLFKQEKFSTEALAMLLFKSLELAADEAKGNKDLAREIFHMIQNLHSWLLRERQEMELRKKKNPPDGKEAN